MKRQFTMLVLTLMLSISMTLPAFAITMTQIDSVTGEIIKVTTEEDAEKNRQESAAKHEAELQEWLTNSYNNTEKQTAYNNAFLDGNRTSAQSYGYIGQPSKVQDARNGTWALKDNAMFYLKDGVLVITGSGHVGITNVITPYGQFGLNENIEAVIIGPGILSCDGAFSALPNLKAVIAMDANTAIGRCFANSSEFTLGSWGDNRSYTQRVILGADLSFKEWTNTADYTATWSKRYEPEQGYTPCVPIEETVMIAPNYNDDVPGGYYNPEVVLPAGLGYDELVARAKELLAHGDHGQQFPAAMYDYLPVELGGTGKITLKEGEFYLGVYADEFAARNNNTTGDNSTGGIASETVPDTNTATNPATTTSNIHVSSWAQSQIDKAFEMDIVPDNTMGSDYTKNITRGQFASLLNRYLMVWLGEDPDTTDAIWTDAQFADGSSGAVANLYYKGIMTGYNSSDDQTKVTIGLNDPLNREQAATILYRFIETVTARSDIWNNNPTPHPFTDNISDWADEAVSACWTVGLMTGYDDTTFGPKDNITIEQAILMVLRTYETAGTNA